MTATTNLDIDHVADGETDKYVRVNEGFDALDAALTETLELDLTSASATPTAAQVRGAFRISVTGVPTSGRTVTLPAVKRPLIIDADSGNTDSVAIVRGSTSEQLAPGESRVFYVDGTTNGLLPIGAASTGGGGLGELSIGATETTDFTPAVGDDNFIPVGAGGDIDITIPTNADEAFDLGTQFTFWRISTGAVNVLGDTGVTVNLPAGTSASARAQYSTISVVKVDTDEWALFGDLTSTGSSSGIDVEEAGSSVATGVTVVNFDGTDFNVTDDGGGLYAGEQYYHGGLRFHHGDVTRVYLSAPVSGVRQIQEWRTSNNGAAWSSFRQITTGGTAGTPLKFRPVGVKGGDGRINLLWCQGTYTSFTNYSTALHAAG
jgi:hypothetical protein